MTYLPRRQVQIFDIELAKVRTVERGWYFSHWCLASSISTAASVG